MGIALKKGWGILFLVFLGCFLFSSPTKAELRDINQSYARNEITSLFEKGYITGYENGAFMPSNPMTRAEFATLLSKALELPLNEASAAPFTDVPSWARPYVGALVFEKITKGTSSTTFGSNQPLTREEMAVFFTRALGLEGVAQSLDLATPFADHYTIHDWARSSVSFLQAIQFIKGAGQKYLPLQKADRQAIARLTYEYVFRFATYIPRVLDITVKTEVPDATGVSFLDEENVEITFSNGEKGKFLLEEIIYGDYYYSIGIRTLRELGLDGNVWVNLDAISKRNMAQIGLGAWGLTNSPFQVMMSNDMALTALVNVVNQFYGQIGNRSTKLVDTMEAQALANNIIKSSK
ncbi:MAG TPA: hypothetical protein DDY49_00985 [Paenibacillaceae bacterium]|nr:hypothetical protein [Paenibacillaceae bacterium]